MRFSLNTLRKGFPEVGHTSLWQCYFDDSKLNVIGGKYFPALTLDFDDIVIKTIPVDYGMGCVIEYPVITTPSVKCTMTFLETDLKAVRAALSTWVKPLENGRVPDMKSYPKKFSIEYLDITGETIDTKVFSVYPIGEYPFKGDQEFSPDSNILTLQMIA